uniref:GRB2 associated binding protein 3 n=1 Tax=Nothobranchius furzeri TaxID=105023 RepID=A0A8C6VX02_NOTFU
MSMLIQALLPPCTTCKIFLFFLFFCQERRPLSCLIFDGPAQPRTKSSNLDYLSLDFNSASPSPVQKKPFLSDEYKVDYVQVDEKKTQALQNTKMEWTDVRQSKLKAKRFRNRSSGGHLRYRVCNSCNKRAIFPSIDEKNK